MSKAADATGSPPTCRFGLVVGMLSASEKEAT
jgi:hypothetical protein